MDNDPKFYWHSHEAWEAMLRLCTEASKSIDLEQFIFSDDKIGQQLVEILRGKARAGVKVRVLCDTVGSWDLYSSRLPTDMRKDGIEIRFVNIVSPWRINNFFSWFFRDHRKILVIDQKIGLTGGTGFRDDMQDWRDTNIEVQNAIVGEMLSVFNEMWARAADKRVISRIKKSKRYTRGFQFITNSPYFRKRFLYYNIIDALRSAREYAFITTPYFVPDRRLARVLKLAAKRGVDVQIILPHFEPEPFVGWATRSHYKSMLEAGVKIFEYKKTFLHAKTIVIDDEWSTVGSFNLDSLSFLYNYEANIVSTDSQIASVLKKQFGEDLRQCEKFTLENWLKRPRIQKIREILIKPIRRFL